MKIALFALILQTNKRTEPEALPF